MKLLRMPGRFEWKILLALFTVASLPLGAAAYLMKVTIGRIEAITDQHQEAVRQSLGGAVDVYKVYFEKMKDSFRSRANEIASGPVERAADLAEVPDLLRARILTGTQVVDEWSAPSTVIAEAHEAPPNLVALPTPGPEPRLLEVTFGIPREIYSNFLALRAAMEEEHELDRLLPVVLPRIFHGLGVALVLVLALAAVLGLFVARRATGRVATLSDAARRVGEGDLTVRVAPRGSDELDDLGRAFDRMVAEVAEARSRLVYLQKVSAWQEVARRLAHEIKNPLTPIQLAVQELASKYRGDDPTYRRLLETATEILNEEVGVIRRLVDDFSAFAKLPKVEPLPVDLGQVVDDFARAHPEWQDALQVAPHTPVAALCDRMLIRRVLANLVENAVQAATAAGKSPSVRLAVAVNAPEGVACLTVDDNGPGVEASARERIFDPYVTTKEHGTGLGLAIVRKIVLDHGGDVRLAEAPAPLGGARFVVTLPTVAGAESTGSPRATPGVRRIL
jgi:two-component system, NtrC family, nitrogen regulation sensor histidine kinase NtrY